MNKMSKIMIVLCCAVTSLSAGQKERLENGERATGALGYAYVYNLADRTVNQGDSVIFDSTGVMSSNITHSNGSADIILSDAGIYIINFFTQGVYASAFVLFVNDVAVPGGSYESITDINDKSAKEYGQIIINAKAGDKINLKNYSPTGAHGIAYLKAAGKPGYPLSVNASLIIQQIK